MYDHASSEYYDWKETDKGNYVCVDADEVAATVFHNGYKWQIIINRDGVGYAVADEYFDDHPEAIIRAEEVLDGADCILTRLNPNTARSTTGWAEQKGKSNGSPTYGRKHEGMGVSVKKAKSGKWFYITYRGTDSDEPQGWYDSAEEAMQAFDDEYS